MILAKGANPLDSSRCLSDAVLGNVEHKMIKRLLDLGCSPNQESDQDKLKRTPMHFACQTPTPLDIIDLLIEYGGDLNLAVGDRLWTPIHYLACANPDSDVLKRICERGGEVNARASDGTTPMAVAAFKRAPEKFFRAMLDVGADPAIETRTGRNPLYYIRNNEEPRVSAGDVRLLLLDPKIHLNQLKSLAKSLHKRLGQKSDARRLNPDILIYVGEFLIGKKVSKCELSHLDTDGGDAVHPPPQ
jgi:ankyrin repeat protein